MDITAIRKNTDRQIARQQKKIAAMKLCPYGCKAGTPGHNAEFGYCRHLVGWTLDDKTIDVRTAKPVVEDGNLYDFNAPAGDTVRETDVIVRMGTPTSRVYRYDGGKANYPVGSLPLPDEPEYPPTPAGDTAKKDAARDEAFMELIASQAKDIEELKAQNQRLLDRLDRLTTED